VFGHRSPATGAVAKGRYSRGRLPGNRHGARAAPERPWDLPGARGHV